MAGEVQTTPSEIANLGQSEPMDKIQSENATTEILPENVTTKILPENATTKIRKIRGYRRSRVQDLILPLTYGEFKALKEDIKTHGCHDPLIIWKDQGIILDGHRRYEI